MNIKGITSALTKNADLLGGVLGFATGSTHGWSDVESSFENLLSGQVHIPDMKNMIRSYLGQPYFKNGLILYGVGWLAKELKVPFLAKYGNAIKKFVGAYAWGSFLNMLLWSCTHGEEGSNPGEADLSRMWQRNVVDANKATENPLLGVYA